MSDPKQKRGVYLPTDIATKYGVHPKEAIKEMWDKVCDLERNGDELDGILRDVGYIPSAQTRKAVCAFHRQERVRNALVEWITKRTGVHPSEEDDM